MSLPLSSEWQVWSSSSGNNYHAVNRSISSGASLFLRHSENFYLVSYCEPNGHVGIDIFQSIYLYNDLSVYADLLQEWVECLPMTWETGVQSQVALYQRFKKWYSISPCLTLRIIKYVLRVKWGNPGEGIMPSPTPHCSSYWKGSLQVALDYGRRLYFTYYDWATVILTIMIIFASFKICTK